MKVDGGVFASDAVDHQQQLPQQELWINGDNSFLEHEHELVSVSSL